MTRRGLAIGALVALAAAPSIAQVSQETTYYWCDNPKGYYPYVQTCSEKWRPVPSSLVYPSAPAPAAPKQSAPSAPTQITPSASPSAPQSPPVADIQHKKTTEAAQTTRAQPPAKSAAPPSPASRPTSPPAKRGVEQERDFVDEVEEARDDFKRAANDMAGGGIRYQRKGKICSALGGNRIEGWKGIIKSLSSSSDGQGVLEILISDHVTVKTFNNQLSDSLSSTPTLIRPGSSLFQTVSGMKEGDLVTFSGTFLPDEADCVKEGSLTLAGSMTQPEFIFQFSSVIR